MDNEMQKNWAIAMETEVAVAERSTTAATKTTDTQTQHHTTHTFVAVDDASREVIGFIHVILFADKSVVENIHVARAARGRGVGRALIVKAAACIRAHSHDTADTARREFTLGVLKSNFDAQKFYQSLGGVFDGRLERKMLF